MHSVDPAGIVNIAGKGRILGQRYVGLIVREIDLARRAALRIPELKKSDVTTGA